MYITLQLPNNQLIVCSLLSPYGNTVLGQDWSGSTKPLPEPISPKFLGIHLRAISEEVLMNFIHNMFGNYYFKIIITLSRSNELTSIFETLITST